MRKLQMTYNSIFGTVKVKVFRARGIKKLVLSDTVKGSGRLVLEIEDDPKYKGNYIVRFYDLFNNALMFIEVEPVDS